MKNKKYYGLYYERVSTVHDSQDESMENQRKLCVSYLKRHPEVELAEPIDTYSERISGKSNLRPRFQAMLDRISQGDIDFVLVKDFKRISRSVEVSSQLKTYAKTYGIRFILLSTGQVYDINANENRMMYGFESLLNEEVVFRQSEYGRIAHRQKCESKKLNANNITFGYRWDSKSGTIVINEEEADIVRSLFDLYVFKNYGILELRRWLADKGYFISDTTVRKYLQETAYIGIFHLNKKGSELGVGAGQKTKRFMNPRDEWVPVERPELAIVDRELFELAQRIRISRQDFHNPDKNGIRQGRFSGTHLFSAKIYCAECGSPYIHGYADRRNTISIYRDSYNARTRNPNQLCQNQKYKRVYEEDIRSIVAEAVNKLLEEHSDCFKILIKAIELVMTENGENVRGVHNKKKELARLEKAASKIMARFEVATGAMLSDLNDRYNEIKEQIVSIEAEIERLNNLDKDKVEIQNKLGHIEMAVSEWSSVDAESLDRQTVERFIHKIFITKEGCMDILLNTTEHLKVGKSAKESSTLNDSDIIGNLLSVFQTIRKEPYKYMEVLSFMYEEKIGNRRTGNKLTFNVVTHIAVAW